MISHVGNVAGILLALALAVALCVFGIWACSVAVLRTHRPRLLIALAVALALSLWVWAMLGPYGELGPRELDGFALIPGIINGIAVVLWLAFPRDVRRIAVNADFNRASWERIPAFIASLEDEPQWTLWAQSARHVVSELESVGLAECFQIGQSLHHIIFSTLEHRGVGGGDYCVTLDFKQYEAIVRVTYGRSNLHFVEPDLEDVVAVEECVPRIVSQLRRLWQQTKPDEPVPACMMPPE